MIGTEEYCCPDCGVPLVVNDSIQCPKCRKDFPVVRGVPRFVDSEHYVSNFGFQWNKHKRTQYDSDTSKRSEEFLRNSLGLTPEIVKNKSVLDAGCGSGRFSEVINRWGGRVTALDLSSAVEACKENLGASGVNVAQGDILHPPFGPETFDVIFSAGVLHHTPDAAGAFHSLVPLLKPGGYIAVWLYHAYSDGTVREQLYRFYRRLSWRLPPRVLYALCYLAIPWYYLGRVPLVRSITGRLWHISEDPSWRWRVLDTYDWYSPKYQSHHTYWEIWQWFEQNGLTDIRIFPTPVAVGGHKPCSTGGTRASSTSTEGRQLTRIGPGC